MKYQSGALTREQCQLIHGALLLSLEKESERPGAEIDLQKVDDLAELQETFGDPDGRLITLDD